MRKVSRAWSAPALALAGVGMVLLAGCTDGNPSLTTPPETTLAQDHLGNGFHWDLITTSPQPVNGATWEFPVPANVGTGNINSFLRVQSDPQEDGFNTDGKRNYDQKGGNFTHSILLSDVPTILMGPDRMKELIFDANESNSDLIAAQFAINEFDLWECDTGSSAPATYEDRAQLAANCILAYEINDGTTATGRAMATDAATQGSGQALDYRIFIPETLFGGLAGCEYAPQGSPTCQTYLILDTDMGDASDPDWETGATFEELSIVRRPKVEVSKTAVGSFTRTYNWVVTKVADEELHQLLPDETGTTEYTITADLDPETPYTDSDFEVGGVITIENVWKEAALVDDIWDELPDGTTLLFADLECTDGGSPVTELPYELGSGDVVTCSYGSAFNGGTTNTAHVAISDPADPDTDLPDEMATADVVFSDTTEVNDVVDVYDEYMGSDDPDASPVLLGQASVDDPPPTSFTRTRMWTFDFPSTDACGVFDNTGSVYPADADPSTDEPLATDDAEVTVTCAHLTVTKDAETSLTRTWNWTIDKSVDPAAWELFTGDEGTSEYTVSVDRVDYTDSDWAVSGNITVTNDGPFDVTLASVTDLVNGSTSATVDCGVSFPYLLAKDAELACTYETGLGSGDPGTNVAAANIQGDGSFSSDPVDFDFTDPVVTPVNDEINVTDTNGMTWGPVGDDTTWNYDVTFACDGDEGTHDNTASIDETGQSDDASVTVDCYGLKVEKDANTSLTRTWEWSIEKDVDESVFEPGTYDSGTNTATILQGASLLVEWDVTLDASSTDSDWAVDGTITVTNNHPSTDAMLTDVTDLVSPDIAATVTCAESSVPAGGSIECTYESGLADASTRSNTATATLQNKAYDKDGFVEDLGTTDFSSDPVSVDFAGAEITKVDDCVDVGDLLEQGGVEVGSQDLGTYCADQGLPKVFDVQFTFGGTDGIPLECGDNLFDNTGTFVTNDTGATDDATSSIDIFVECVEGCTLTQGYWKTHNASFWGGAPPDETWLALGDLDEDGVEEYEGEEFYLSGQSWFDVFWTAPKGNAYYNLAHQYMAAYLNMLAGASAPAEVTSAMTDAEALFQAYWPDDIDALHGKNGKDLRKQFIDLAGTLGDYNEGLIGPGHCTENTQDVISSLFPTG